LFRRLFGKQEEKTQDEINLEQSLQKTRSGIFGRISTLFQENEITEALWEELEETLIVGDVGVTVTADLVEKTRRRVEQGNIKATRDAYLVLKEEMVKLLVSDEPLHIDEPRILTVVLVVGVNGSGKTTSIGKMANLYKKRGRKVVLGAADTFRAAAADQLETWGARVGVPTVRSARDGADPAAVAFDAVKAGIENEVDVVLLDTAGRLHNKTNLMDELGKIKRVVEKQSPIDEVLLVLDATTGQNGLRQAEVFAQVVGITGIVLTKLDGTAKGGIVVAVQRKLGVPVKLVGLGEGPDDLAPFDPEQFVDAIVA